MHIPPGEAGLAEAGTYGELNSLLPRTWLGGLLGASRRQWTLFAPTDAAFDALPHGMRQDLESAWFLRSKVRTAPMPACTAVSAHGCMEQRTRTRNLCRLGQRALRACCMLRCLRLPIGRVLSRARAHADATSCCCRTRRRPSPV